MKTQKFEISKQNRFGLLSKEFESRIKQQVLLTSYLLLPTSLTKISDYSGEKLLRPGQRTPG
jgi:hypothetical protein